MSVDEVLRRVRTLKDPSDLIKHVYMRMEDDTKVYHDLEKISLRFEFPNICAFVDLKEELYKKKAKV